MRRLSVSLVEFSPSGGLFQFALQMGEAIAQLGHQVELVTGRDPELQPRVSGMRLAPILPTWHPGAPGVESVLLQKARRPFRGALHLEAWRRLLRHLGRSRPDVVQLAAWRFAVDGWFASRLASREHAPVMIELTHAPEPMAARDSRESLTARPLMRRALADAYRHMDAVLVLGERSRRQLLRAWPEAGRVEVIPHGDERIFARGGVPTPDRCPPRVLLFGTLTWYKGTDLLLDAFELVRAAVPEAELVIAGAVSRDVDVAALTRRASTIGGVSLRPGYVPHDRVPGLFGSARVVVAPYRIANQSGVVHLAQTLGRPVVATDVGDLRDAVVHGQTGLLVPADDVAALAAALARLLRNPQEAARLGSAGARRLAAEASWAQVAARVVSLYQELLDAKSLRDREHARDA